MAMAMMTMLAAWTRNQTIVFCIPIGLILVGALVGFLLRNTIRTRMAADRKLRLDQDINEWMVVFNWSRKILYVPTIGASLVAGILTLCFSAASDAHTVIGGCWLAVFFLNFLIDEYEMSIKILLLILLVMLLGWLWLLFMGWLDGFLGIFTFLQIRLSAAGYFVIAGIFLLAIIVAWVRGLFFYVAITSNYLNIQTGPTETGEQISHSDYNTRVDTSDFLERLLGFGRIIITFRDHRRAPLILLVGKIGKRARRLESIRGKIAVDRYQPDQGV
jgi:hypothetical protein